MKPFNTIKTCLLFLFNIVITTLQAQTTEFYGMTGNGGTYNKGVIFKTDNNGENYTVVHNFDGDDGNSPDHEKLCYVNNILYGTTRGGGIYGVGVLFSYNPANKTYTKLHDFDVETSGSSPKVNVILALNGKLYGTTSLGGLYNYGTLFDFDIQTGILTKKLDFDGVNMGRQIFSNVMQASNGKLYGTTNVGGANNAGVLYEYDYNLEVFTKLVDFESATQGNNPRGLIEVKNNILYGTSAGGGTSGGGIIFEYAILTNTLTKKFDFKPSISGYSPVASLIKASNGKLYGLTRYGNDTSGSGKSGVLYEYDTSTEAFTVKQDFLGDTGAFSTSVLLEASNGYLYGLTFYGGLSNNVTLIEYRIDTNQLIKKLDFANDIGIRPQGGLIEIEKSILSNDKLIHNPLEVMLWPNPVNDMLNIKFNEDFQFNMKIYNLLGQELNSDSQFKTNHQLNVSHLNSGIYILKLTMQNGNIHTIKFIKN